MSKIIKNPDIIIKDKLEPESEKISKRDTQSRKYNITINSPIDYGFSHDEIKRIFAECLSSVKYFCMADEQGSCHHTHIYAVFASPVRFSTIKKHFTQAHIESARGNSIQNREYIAKTGKWADNADKYGTIIDGTFEEYGEIPSENQGNNNQIDYAAVLERIQDGASNAEILMEFPSNLRGLRDVDYARQSLLEEDNRDKWRTLEVTYICGETGTGKTRYVMEKYGYANVYRVTNYNHPFDEYRGQEVLMFDEFCGQFMLQEMLNYLDGYPLALPARYNNKQAAYTEVYIISNFDIKDQYRNVQKNNPLAWRAFIRRIHKIIFFFAGGRREEYDAKEYVNSSFTVVMDAEDDNPFLDDGYK